MLDGADAIATEAGLAEGRVNEALVELEAVALHHAAAHFAHQVIEDPGLGPMQQPIMHNDLRAELPGRSFRFAPLSWIQNALKHLAF